MKSEIAGKILSDVRGVSDTKAAVAKELKATSTNNDDEYICFDPITENIQGMPVHRAVLSDCGDGRPLCKCA